MKLIAIDTTIDWESKRMDVVHKLLFHGLAIRSDASDDSAEFTQDRRAHSVGDDLSHPLLLIRSGVHIPPLFKPQVALVARHDIYQRIHQYPGLMFADAKPSKLVNCWKPAGDFSLYQSRDPVVRRNIQRPDLLLDWLPNDSSLFATFPICHELVAYNVHKDEMAGSIRVHFTMNNDRETDIDFTCTTAIIDTYPLIWSSAYFIRRELFDLIQDVVDPDHFAMMTVEL